ncbi:MAG TPA: ExeM/NucH family extracellular endonuclease [Alcanivorax sp.]|nr:ExeM/NucH family extracellular endonuclease [Alcanivorax sp.]
MKAFSLVIAGTLMAGGVQANVLISEYVEGSGFNKALELYNGGAETVSLDGYSLQRYSNGGAEVSAALGLDGESLAAGAVLVIVSSQAEAPLAGLADMTSGVISHNGDDAYVLRDNDGVVDSFGRVGEDPGSAWGSGAITTANQTLRRLETVDSGDTVTDDPFDPAHQWRAFPQDTLDGLGVYGEGGGDGGGDHGDNPPPALGACGDVDTAISAIQGSAASTPLGGENLVVESVVSAVYPGLDGFFLMEPTGDRDDDPATSEGLFVYAPDAVVSSGDRVRLAGTAGEYFEQTQLSLQGDPLVCAGNQTLEPVAFSLPFADAGAPEALEGMLVNVSQGLTVTEVYDLARYGSVMLADGRLSIPTQVAAPGAPAQAVKAQNALNRIILDDGLNTQNPEPVRYPQGGLSAGNTLRVGDSVDSDFRAIISYGFDAWRLQPVDAVTLRADNPRPPAPPRAAGTNLRVAAFNVLNFFNGDGQGGGFPTARGADNAEELARQKAKLVAALTALDADIIGLMEIENDGYGPDSAVAELAEALGPAWRFVAHGEAGLGTDAIAVGLLYRDDVVAEAGEAATLTSGAFGNETNRQPLAQSFRLLNNGEVLTVAVNHFKSKSSCPDDGINAAQGDGQSCWNPERTDAANDQLAWLATDPTGAGDSDVVVLGDLNAYAQEDPITAFRDAGFVDLLARFQGEDAYSYVFKGETGYLDHALASPSLNEQVLAAGAWHINADEPRALDYNKEFKSDRQVDDFFAADAYRASDHDPLRVDLNLTASDEDGGAPAEDDSGGGGGLGWLMLALVLAAGRRRRARETSGLFLTTPCMARRR